MKKQNISEKNFEVEYVVKVLIEKKGYRRRTPDDYDNKLYLDRDFVFPLFA